MCTSTGHGTAGSPTVLRSGASQADADLEKTDRIVLCVDDDRVVLCLQRLLLETAGFAVLTASDYEEALSAFSIGCPDVVVLDYAIRGTTGGALAAQMRHLCREVPLILYSGGGEVPKKDRLLFDRVLLKGTAAQSLIPVLCEMFPPEGSPGPPRGNSAGEPAPEGMILRAIPGLLT